LINYEENQNLVQRVKNSEQVISMIMGVLVVLAIGGLAYRYFQGKGLPSMPKKNQEQEQQQDDTDQEEKETELPATHSVNQGESLWDIAEQYYLSGYNWVDIAEENNLSSPDLLAVGQELNIPDVEKKEMTVTQLPDTGVAEDMKIEGGTYTVKEGDSLSKIALRAYGDMFEWPKIWGANRESIDNPNVIEPGMELEIPRD